MSAASQLPTAMTVAQFLAWTPPHDVDRWELIDGTPCAMSPSSPRHGAIQPRQPAFWPTISTAILAGASSPNPVSGHGNAQRPRGPIWASLASPSARKIDCYVSHWC
jgi:hypothetical protein